MGGSIQKLRITLWHCDISLQLPILNTCTSFLTVLLAAENMKTLFCNIGHIAISQWCVFALPILID